MDRLGRVLENIRQPNVKLAFAETDRGVQRGEAMEADVERGDGSAGA
jgi:hypothetical protein